MPSELYLCYAGLAALALGTYRLRATRLPGGGTVPPRACRALGTLLLLAGLAATIWRLGAAQGMVGWIGATAVAGVALVLMLSVRPTLAILPALPFLWPLRLVTRHSAAAAIGGPVGGDKVPVAR